MRFLHPRVVSILGNPGQGSSLSGISPPYFAQVLREEIRHFVRLSDTLREGPIERQHGKEKDDNGNDDDTHLHCEVRISLSTLSIRIEPAEAQRSRIVPHPETRVSEEETITKAYKELLLVCVLLSIVFIFLSVSVRLVSNASERRTFRVLQV